MDIGEKEGMGEVKIGWEEEEFVTGESISIRSASKSDSRVTEIAGAV